MPAAQELVVTIADVEAAAVRLRGIAHRSPVLQSRTLDALVGADVFLKAENLQRTGSFKFRGAFNKIASLGERAAAGVITFSSGNHGQAVAYSAALLGIPAVVFMPGDAPTAKSDAVDGYGAEVVRYDRYTDDREALVADYVADTAMTIVPPFDDRLIMAGQGTAALELLDETGPLDVLLVPVGGGGLIAGCATAVKASWPSIRVVGVEPAAGDDVRRSLAAGKRVESREVPETIADGLQAPAPGELTFEVIHRLVDEVVTVTDTQILVAMRFMFERQKLVTEPSGAVAIAALLSGAVAVPGRRVGAIISGGNVGVERFQSLLDAAGCVRRSRLRSNR